MNKINLILAICLLLLSVAHSQSETKKIKKEPLFASYPWREVFQGKPADVDLKSHKDARRFRTRLREGAKQGPNFSGHYTIIEIGAGTGVQQVVIVSAKSGAVYFLPFSCEVGTKYKLDSNLLIVNSPEMVKEVYGNGSYPPQTYYLLWNGKECLEIK